MAKMLRHKNNLTMGINDNGVYATNSEYDWCHSYLIISWDEVEELLEEHKKMNGEDKMEAERAIIALKSELMKNRNECAHMKEEIDKLEIEINQLDEEIKKKDKVIDCEVDKLLKSGGMMVNILNNILLTKDMHIYNVKIYRDEVYESAEYHRDNINHFTRIVLQHDDRSVGVGILKDTIYLARMFIVECLR